jgi:hypothetical protein
LDGDAFGLCDTEFNALKSFFSASGNDMNLEEDEENDVVRPRKKQRGSNVYTVEDRHNSLFRVKYLPRSDTELALLRNECSPSGKKFRRRFRIPYVIFENIRDEIIELFYSDRKTTDSRGREVVDIALLVLGALRFVATGCTYDALDELTCVAGETHRVFIRDIFTSWGRHAAKEHIRLPVTDEEIRHVTGMYERSGCPGCIGSVDCVHIVWDKCNAGMRSLCCGKEKVPTLVFEVVCSHTKRILHVSKWFGGTVSDKTIAKIDPAMDLVKQKYKSCTWKSLYVDEDGIEKEKNHVGYYYICDGGYHLWETLIPPYKHQIEGSDEMSWSHNIEAIRKDIECVFGILKKRFLFLKNPIRLHHPETIDALFVTCCVLHNILLDYDGYDNWEEVMLEDDECINVQYGILETIGVLTHGGGTMNSGGFTRNQYRNNVGNNSFLIDINQNDEEYDYRTTTEDALRYHARRDDLVEHYKVMCDHRALALRR